MNHLVQVPLFSGFNEEQLTQLQRHAVIRIFRKNSVVITEGDRSDSLYVVLSGRLRVYCGDEHGREVTLNDLKDGDHFGELALFDEGQRSASVITVEDSRLLILHQHSVREALLSNPELSYNLIVHLTQRIRGLTHNVKNLALLDVYGRVARTLLALSECRDGQRVTEIPLTQQEIANRVGASREMVSRIMKDLTDGGYIHVDHKKIIIDNALPWYGQN